MEKLSDRWMFYCGLLVGMNVSIDDLKHIQDLIDAEEKGLLIKLPCEIGTKVYRLIDGGKYRGWYYIPIEFDLNDLKLFERGLLAFSKEEAEQKLAEMKEY